MRVSFAAALLALTVFALPAFLQANEECFDCHDDPEMTGEGKDGEISLYVDPEKYGRSIHADNDCVDCHVDLDGVETPHKEKLERPRCDGCHEEVSEIYERSLHGRALLGAPLAPFCWDCHGDHEILPGSNPKSTVAKFRIPFVCGKCHKEGSEVTQTYDIPQENILSHYSQSIHGEGLFKQGLTVTAVCTDCHTSHDVLPHTDPRSSIHKDQVSKTCQKCHGLIEQVHQKIIRSELWEKEPNLVPICVECHKPHEIQKVFYVFGMSDRECLNCHSDPKLTGHRDGNDVSMYVDAEELHGSVHKDTNCSKCHTDADPTLDRPCETTPKRVDCSICHAEEVRLFDDSQHGRLFAKDDPNAPGCGDCHGTHETKNQKDAKSPTHPRQIPKTCGICHQKGKTAAVRIEGEAKEVIDHYALNVHGQGLLEKGLLVSAVCTSCHTSHDIRTAKDVESSVNSENIAETCAHCHDGIYEQFEKSVHATSDVKDKPLPNCETCHSSHQMTTTSGDPFKLEMIDQCGKCHEAVTETYFESYHGKITQLGETDIAKCYDCHGSHTVLPASDPNSNIHPDNRLETCRECHPNTTENFADFVPHVGESNYRNYPALWYTWLFMMFLVVSTFGLFGFHTFFWMVRGLMERRLQKQTHTVEEDPDHYLFYQRFSRTSRSLHVMVIISFLMLTWSGVVLRYSEMPWAPYVAALFGGTHAAGVIHRIGAVITFFYFAIHLFDIARHMLQRHPKEWLGMIFGPDSMMPAWKDWQDFVGDFKWFFGKGPRPKYNRFTYYEKHDYLAVFWGVAVIGLTGLVLWFPEFFTRILPGIVVNMSSIIHSIEALLAMGFIFAIHFFSAHLRPGIFPMNETIFTGKISLHELKNDHGGYYERLVAEGKLEALKVPPTDQPTRRLYRLLGMTALALGIAAFILIVSSYLF